ncbi:MAG: SUMF1/EgtB/PvdO family nonheme iron enzyme [Bacteroidia bacterium]
MIRVLFILVACLGLFSFSFERKKKFIPPGTVQISETFFVDEVEISNFSWYEYEWWTKKKYGVNSAQHLATLPDTNVWLINGSYNSPYTSYYYRHQAYKDYPVVGISYEQALAFCKWRTERVKEFGYIKNKKELKIEYRLPSKEEWEAFSFTFGIPNFVNGKDEKGRMTLNCARSITDTLGIINDNADVTAPVYSYWKNILGIYNSFGNVAEMISEKGICKGGSWVQQLEDCRAGKDIPYEKPTAWLGFRCVCVVKSN